MKSTLTRIINYETTFSDKNNNLRSVTWKSPPNLEKTFEYLKIQESLQSENLTKYYLCEGVFLFDFLHPEKYYTTIK